MGEIILYISLIIFLPIVFLLLTLEKRARRIMLSFMSGILVCFTAFFINTYISKIGVIQGRDFSKFIAPVVEEILKFTALLLIALILKKGKRQSIAISFALGVGFCVVENYFYMFSEIHYSNVFWIIIRCLGTGLMHSMSTTLIGFGLYKARMNPKKSFLIGALALLLSIIYHGTYNILVSSTSTQAFGLLIPLFSYIAFALFIKKDAVKAFFEDDTAENEQ